MKKFTLWLSFAVLFTWSTTVAQWIQSIGPSGGTITTIFVDGYDIWAGTDVDGPYLSTDGGSIWSARREGLTSDGWNAYIGNGYYIIGFARLGSSLFVGTRGYGIYRSDNDGLSWVKSDSGITDPYISSLIVSGSNILAGTSPIPYGTAAGIFLSTNGGTSWSQIPQVIPKDGIVAGFTSFVPGPDYAPSHWHSFTSGGGTSGGTNTQTWSAPGVIAGSSTGTNTIMTSGFLANPRLFGALPEKISLRIYAIVKDSVFFSTDDGVSWTAASGALPGYDYQSIFAHANVLYACMGRIWQASAYIVRSFDSAKTWHRDTSTSVYNGEFAAGAKSFAVVGSFIIAAVRNAEGYSVGSDFGGIYRFDLRFGGKWEQIDNGAQFFDARAVAVYGTTLLGGFTNGGLYKSNNDGTSWTKSDQGISNTDIGPIIQMGSLLFTAAGTPSRINYNPAGRGDGVYRSSDNGATWTRLTTTGPLSSNFSPYHLFVDGNRLLLSGSSGVFWSLDSGNTWTQSGGLSSTDMAYWSSFCKNDSGLIAGGHGFYQSTDGGANWSKRQGPLYNADVQSIVCFGPVYVATGTGSPFRSTDYGATWTYMNGNPSDLVMRLEGNTIFAYNGAGGIYKSIDTGQTWIGMGGLWNLPTNHGLTSMEIVKSGVDTVLFVSVASGAGHISPFAGVYRSTDIGQTWVHVDSSLGGMARSVLRMIVSNDKLIIGTWGRGIWSRPLSDLVTSVEEPKVKGIPSQYSLEQNYPNPFNPSTIVRYEIPIISHVRVKVFNVLGQEVMTLVDELQDAGYKSVEWNASGTASGVYFYRLEATSAADQGKSFVEIRKMLLVK